MSTSVSKSILILEDEPLIAMDHEHYAERAGFTQITVISSRAAAEEWLQSQTPAVALLDIQLKDGPSSSVATLLRNKGVPFVICSGSGNKDADPNFHDGIWLPKPCIPEELFTALTQAKAKVAK
ncbi:response regulator [Pararhizobium qamdonense]|uniref:response regulator n=1 Tax=Pararhizobium qamdonense TaxID=3031126 RepID=UPI0023E10EAF|nr:response regulator [Pararhizobium qamdonense]